MTTSTSVDDLVAICRAIQARAIDATHQRCHAATSEANLRGMLHSSRTILSVDKAATDTFADFAAEVFTAVSAMNDAQPTNSAAERRNQLMDLLEAQLRELGAAVKSARDKHRAAAQAGLTNTSLIEDSRVQPVIDRAVAEYRGRLGLAIEARVNMEPQPRKVVLHSPVINASVVSYQAGDSNTATITQSVAIKVSAVDAKVALDALIEALQLAQHVAPDQRTEVVEVLEQITQRIVI
jgi:hypothetical protein